MGASDATSHCFCEYGHSGADCSRRVCPKAFDPLEDGALRTISVTLGAARGLLAGEVGFEFNGERVAFPAGASADGLAAALSALPNVGAVAVSRSPLDASNGATYAVTFEGWPLLPHENNVHTLGGGDPPLDAFACNTTGIDAAVANPHCTLRDVVGGGAPLKAGRVRKYAVSAAAANSKRTRCVAEPTMRLLLAP
jgi:hypothetical protein